MVFKTRITEMFGIEHPVLQGGMHYVGYAEMAAAVSNAGGLGIVTALTQPTPEKLREEIRKTAKLTDKPFAVNLTLLPMIAGANMDDYVKVIIEEGVKVVETAGRPPKQYVPALKEAGIKIIHKCVTVRHAVSAQKLGVDAISLDGFDCGGHPGEQVTSNWILAPLGAEQLKIPFVVSGGVGNGHQLAAALAMGADGINAGTLFMATKEAPIHDNIKQAIVEGNEDSTTHIFTTLSNTERVYKNKTTLKVREIEAENPGDFGAIRDLVRGDNYRKSFQETGNTEDSAWSCGQSIALIHDVPTCKELVARLVADAEQSMKRVQSLYASKL